MKEKFDLYKYPRNYFINITGFCNLSCNYCSSVDFNECNSMNRQQIQIIINQLKELGVFHIIKTVFTAIVSFIILFRYHAVLAVISLFMYLPQFIADNCSVKDNNKFQVDIAELLRKKDYFSFVLENKKYTKELRVYHLNHFFVKKYQLVWKKNSTFYYT